MVRVIISIAVIIVHSRSIVKYSKFNNCTPFTGAELECEGGRGVRGCSYTPSIMEYEGGRGVRGCTYSPSIMECDGGREVRGSTYRSKYRTFSVHYGIDT